MKSTCFHSLLALVVSFACIAAPQAAWAQKQDDKRRDSAAGDEDPPALTHYMGRQIAQTMHYAGAPWLARESREQEERCSLMLENLHVRPGTTVCDMGCGNGFYTLKLARMVGPQGKVLAVDIQPEMLRMLEDNAKKEDLANIELIHGTVIDPRLPEGKVDLMLCVDVYHEFSHPEQMLAAMRKSLSPRGLLALVEFRTEDPKVPIKPEHKMSKKQAVAELSANGFKLVKEYDGLPWQHLMFFARDDAWTPPAR